MKWFGMSRGWTPIERLRDGIDNYPQMKGARMEVPVRDQEVRHPHRATKGTPMKQLAERLVTETPSAELSYEAAQALEQAETELSALRERNEELTNAIATHRAYIYHARDRWPGVGDGAVQVTSGDISLWAEVGIENPTWTWKARFQEAEKALRNIAGERCEAFMGPRQWECHYTDKTPDGTSLVTRWCDPCIAAAGLGLAALLAPSLADPTVTEAIDGINEAAKLAKPARYCGVLFPAAGDAFYCNLPKGHEGSHARVRSPSDPKGLS